MLQVMRLQVLLLNQNTLVHLSLPSLHPVLLPYCLCPTENLTYACPACDAHPAGSCAEPEYLGARMAVSPQPTAAGVTVAVAAKRGRIACLTVSLDSDGSAQLSTPVLYALPALQILGASYKLMKQRELELGNVMDLVVLPTAGGQDVQLAFEHLAVLSHK
jgi:hypothetical protein